MVKIEKDSVMTIRELVEKLKDEEKNIVINIVGAPSGSVVVSAKPDLIGGIEEWKVKLIADFNDEIEFGEELVVFVVNAKYIGMD